MSLVRALCRSVSIFGVRIFRRGTVPVVLFLGVMITVAVVVRFVTMFVVVRIVAAGVVAV